MSKREALLRGLCIRWGILCQEADAARKRAGADLVVSAALAVKADTLDYGRVELETVLGLRTPANGTPAAQPPVTTTPSQP